MSSKEVESGPSSPDLQVTEHPDDGKEAPLRTRFGPWIQVLGGFLAFFNIWGFPLSFGLFQDFYTLTYLNGYSASSVSWIGTFQNFLVVIIGSIGGPLYDLGYYPHMMIIGPILNVLGIMMISLSTEYYQLFLAHACNGIGGGLLYVPVLTTVAQGHGEKYRPLAMGLVAAGNGLGGILYTIVFLKLQPSSLGFAWTVRVMGFMALLCFLVAVPTLLAGEHPKRGGRARALVDKAAFTDAKFMVFAWGQMLGFWGYIPFIFYLTIYAQVKLGASSTTAYYLLVGAQGGSTLGRVMAGLLARYLGTMIPWIACLIASGILALAWIGAQNIGGFAAVVVLFGFFSGSLIALPPSIFPVVCPRKEVLGTRLGMSWAVTSIASLTGGPIAGALIDLNKADFLGLQIWCGVVLLAAIVLLGPLWFMLYKQHHRILI